MDSYARTRARNTSQSLFLWNLTEKAYVRKELALSSLAVGCLNQSRNLNCNNSVTELPLSSCHRNPSLTPTAPKSPWVTIICLRKATGSSQ